MPFEFERLEAPGLILIKPKRFEDERGFFMETYKHSDFNKVGITEDFVQDNHSKSAKNVLRGLHFQTLPKAQAKLVRCIRGKLFDVAVDIRKGSRTYGKWVGKKLSEQNGHILYMPVGFAHGFLSLEEGTEINYKVSEEYSPENEAGIYWNDPDLQIDWPLETDPVVSEKDSKLPKLTDVEPGFSYEELR